MKDNEIVGVDDLSTLLGPFFGTRIGRTVGNSLLRQLQMDKVNKIHSDLFPQLSGQGFAHAALSHPLISVSHTLHGREHLNQMNQGGPFIVVSNHPFGGLDGLLLIDLIGQVRPDFKLMGNAFLSQIAAIRDSIIPVKPRQNRSRYVHDVTHNVSGLKALQEHIAAGYAIGLFPAGGIANSRMGVAGSFEQIWQLSSIRLIQRAAVPVYPVFIEGKNSLFYQRLSRLNYTLSTLRIPSEIFNKRGKEIGIHIGSPLSPKQIASYGNVFQLRDYLMQTTLSLPLSNYRHEAYAQ